MRSHNSENRRRALKALLALGGRATARSISVRVRTLEPREVGGLFHALRGRGIVRAEQRAPGAVRVWVVVDEARAKESAQGAGAQRVQTPPRPTMNR